jgi:hypothetical protein
MHTMREDFGRRPIPSDARRGGTLHAMLRFVQSAVVAAGIVSRWWKPAGASAR